jgi:hypothetical protein
MEECAEAFRTNNLLVKSQRKGSRKAYSQKDLRIATPPVSHPIPTDTCQNDPDLAVIIESWDRLPEGVRQSVVMLVKAASGK